MICNLNSYFLTIYVVMIMIETETLDKEIRMKKKLFLVAWLMVCSLGLAACGGRQANEMKVTNEAEEVKEVADTDEVAEDEVVEDTVVEEEQMDFEAYPANYVKRDQKGLFGNETYKKNDMLTITIKDSLEGMAADAWDVSEYGDGSVMAWVENGTDFCIGGEGGVTARDCEELFWNFSNVTSIELNDCFYSEPATNFKDMFSGNWNLTELDLSSLNTSNATTMEEMFQDCTRLLSIDVTSFDTSNVENMASMFAFCQELKEIDVSSFDTSNVTDFTAMFKACYKVEKLDLSGFDLSQSRSCKEMFLCCELLTGVDCELQIPSGIDTTDMYDRSGME